MLMVLRIVTVICDVQMLHCRAWGVTDLACKQVQRSPLCTHHLMKLRLATLPLLQAGVLSMTCNACCTRTKAVYVPRQFDVASAQVALLSNLTHLTDACLATLA